MSYTEKVRRALLRAMPWGRAPRSSSFVPRSSSFPYRTLPALLRRSRLLRAHPCASPTSFIQVTPLLPNVRSARVNNVRLIRRCGIPQIPLSNGLLWMGPEGLVASSDGRYI